MREFLNDRWLPSLDSTGIKPTTMLGYQLHVERYINPALGHVPLQMLTASHLEGLYASLLKNGGRTRVKGSARALCGRQQPPCPRLSAPPTDGT